MTPSKPQPIQSSTQESPGTAAGTPPRLSRLLGLDVLRALAVLGMVYMHVSPTGWFSAVPFAEKAVALGWFEGMITGRAMSLFVLMAGISLALMTGGSRPHSGERLRTDRKRMAIRAAVLFVISLAVDQFSGMNLSILEFYSIWLLLLIPLLRLSPRTLLTAAAIAGVALPIFSFIVMNYGRDWPISPFSGGGQVAVGLPLLWQPLDWPFKLKQLFFGGGFQTPYAIPLLLAGVAVGRFDLRSAAMRRNLALSGAVLVAGSWAVSQLALGPLGAEQALADMMASRGPLLQPWISLLTLPPHQLYAFSIPMAPFMFGIGLLMLSGLLSLLQLPGWQSALNPLTSTGRMALTWYAAHHIFIQRVAGDPPYAFTLFAGMMIFALIVSPLWLRRRSRGPLEWLMHRASLIIEPERERAARREAVPGSSS